MGRSIKKKWFTAKAGSVAGNLNITIFPLAPEVIIRQKGTGVYLTASGRQKLKDGEPTVAGEAQLTHDDGVGGVKNVRKIAQYRLYYFDGTSTVWRDKDGNVVGTFVPALTPESGEPGGPAARQATATGTNDGGVVDSITITDGGAGYTSAPGVAISGNGSGATATATINGLGEVDNINITAGGTGYTTAVTVAIAAP